MKRPIWFGTGPLGPLPASQAECRQPWQAACRQPPGGALPGHRQRGEVMISSPFSSAMKFVKNVIPDALSYHLHCFKFSGHP